MGFPKLSCIVKSNVVSGYLYLKMLLIQFILISNKVIYLLVQIILVVYYYLNRE